jgi:hypothetical protein
VDGLCGSPDPLGSPGLRLYGPHGIHGSSDLSETGSDGACGFPDLLGSPGLLALAVTRGYLFLLVSLVFMVESYGTPVAVSAPS